MSNEPQVIKRTGRDRSGRAPRATSWSNFYQSISQWAHDAEGGAQTYPSEPYMSNRVLNASAEYHTDDLARGGGSENGP